MKVSVEMSSEYKDPYAVIYTDQVTDEIQSMIDIFNVSDSPIIALRNEEDVIILKPVEIYMIQNCNNKLHTFAPHHTCGVKS